MKHLAKRAVQLYPIHDYAERRSVIHLRKSWVRSMLHLGEKWVLFLAKNQDAAVFAVCLATLPLQLIWGLP